MTARQAAKDLIRVYVLRGDSIEQLVAGGMGSWGRDYCTHISGSICPDDVSVDKPGDWRLCRKINARQVAARVPGAEWAVFRLEQLYAEILAERDGAPVQAALF
jgi:hypothetical protein